ncbi:MAG: hypothetical protein ACOY4D_01850 [Pseudomonadota bacterium]
MTRRILRFLNERIAHLDNPPQHRRSPQGFPSRRILEVPHWRLPDYQPHRGSTVRILVVKIGNRREGVSLNHHKNWRDCEGIDQRRP